MKVLVSFEKDANSNYMVCYKKQKIIVLPGAFKRLTGSNGQSIVGSLYVEYSSLPEFGFIKEPIVNIVQEKPIIDMTVDEIFSLLDREGIQIRASSM
jgi:hypothetical protein